MITLILCDNGGGDGAGLDACVQIQECIHNKSEYMEMRGRGYYLL